MRMRFVSFRRPRRTGKRHARRMFGIDGELPAVGACDSETRSLAIMRRAPGDDIAIERGVVFGGAAPRHVGAHPVEPHAPHGRPDRRRFRARGRARRTSSRPRAGRIASRRDAGGERRFVGVDHRVGEPADARDDRHRAVAQRAELGEPAGLEARGHEKEVAPAWIRCARALVIAEMTADAAAALRPPRRRSPPR